MKIDFMNKTTLGLLAILGLTATTTFTARADMGGTVTIDFTQLAYTTSLTSLNDILAAYGISVDAGYPNTIGVGGGNNLTAGTDPAASDLLFNFSSPVSWVSVTTGGPGGIDGAYGMDINTTAAAGFALSGTHTIVYQGGHEGDILILTHAGIKSVQFEDQTSTASIASISFITEPVPEPATCGFMALGAVALAGARWRRSAK